MIAWMPGAAPSIAANASTSEFGPRCQVGRRGRPDHSRHVAQLGRDLLGVAAVLDEDVERLHHAGADPCRGELVATGDRGAAAGEVLQLRLVRVQLRPEAGEHADDHQADGRGRDRAPQHETRPAPPGPVLGMAAVDESPRHHPNAVDPLAEHGEHRRQQRERGEHGDDRDQHAADAHRAQQRQRQHDQRQQTERHRRARDDHGASGVGHRLHERRLDIVAFAQLVAEAEDHQQGVVDRDTETDERDQELHDDRDVGDVGQRPHEREGVEDRGERDGERHQHRRQRPEHEQQDHERAEPADHRFQEDARPAARAVLARLLERVVARDVDGDAGREAGGGGGAHLLGAALLVEPARPGRIDLLEGGVPVTRDVHEAAGREVRARARAGHRGGGALHRRLDRRALGRVAAGVEDDDVRRADAEPQGLERPLAGLVGRLAGDRRGSDTSARTAGRPRPRRTASARPTCRSPASGDGR